MLVVISRTCSFLLLACLGACWAQAAAAIDLNVDPVTPSPPQRPDWAGFYLRSNPGGNSDTMWQSIGAATGASSPFASPGAAAHPVNENFGYNFQSGNFVFGLEGSYAAANFDGKFTAPYLPAAAAWSPNTNWLGTVAGKFGFSFGQWLPYLKGGFAAADVGSPLQSGVTGFSQSSSDHSGWTAGVGFEYQLTSKWSLGLEYLYTDLGSGGAPNSLGSGGSPEVYSTALKSQSLLGRLNYKAGW